MISLKKLLPNVDTTQPTKYPYGRYKNDDSPGDLTGTPTTADTPNDLTYGMYAVLDDANISPSTYVENVQISDFLNAINNKDRKLWSPKRTYIIGDICYRVATSPLLGKNANKVTMVFRSLTNGNTNNPLPDDFMHNSNWSFIDVLQPQALNLSGLSNYNLLDFSGHIGEIRTTTVDEGNVPLNWGICDGRNILLPNNTKEATPDLQDRFLIATSKGKVKGTTGGSWNHNTDGHALSVAQMPYHTHTYDRADTSRDDYCGEHNNHTGAPWNQGWNTGGAGGNQTHYHGISNLVSPYYSLFYIRRMF